MAAKKELGLVKGISGGQGIRGIVTQGELPEGEDRLVGEGQLLGDHDLRLFSDLQEEGDKDGSEFEIGGIHADNIAGHKSHAREGIKKKDGLKPKSSGKQAEGSSKAQSDPNIVETLPLNLGSSKPATLTGPRPTVIPEGGVLQTVVIGEVSDKGNGDCVMKEGDEHGEAASAASDYRIREPPDTSLGTFVPEMKPNWLILWVKLMMG